LEVLGFTPTLGQSGVATTEDQVADIFTKVLGAKKHHQFHSMLGVMQLELSLKGSVEMSSSIRADTHDVLG
jgi:hypothetical protein